MSVIIIRDEMLPLSGTNKGTLWQVRLSTYRLVSVTAVLRGNLLDTALGLCSAQLTGLDVMSSKYVIFINLQRCRDLTVPTQQLVDCDWLTKPLLFNSDERWEIENNCINNWHLAWAFRNAPLTPIALTSSVVKTDLTWDKINRTLYVMESNSEYNKI